MKRKINAVNKIADSAASVNELYVSTDSTDIVMNIKPIRVDNKAHSRDSTTGKDNVIALDSSQEANAVAVSITANNSSYYAMMESEKVLYAAAKAAAAESTGTAPTKVSADPTAKSQYGN